MGLFRDRNVQPEGVLCPECEKVREKLHRLSESESVWYEEHRRESDELIRKVS